MDKIQKKQKIVINEGLHWMAMLVGFEVASYIGIRIQQWVGVLFGASFVVRIIIV